MSTRLVYARCGPLDESRQRDPFWKKGAKSSILTPTLRIGIGRIPNPCPRCELSPRGSEVALSRSCSVPRPTISKLIIRQLCREACKVARKMLGSL